MTTVTVFVDQHFAHDLDNLFIADQRKLKGVEEEREKEGQDQTSAITIHDGVCVICLDNIQLQETALVKGCEHAYCVTCILQWATYHEHPKCPQCKQPFESLSVHRALDGSLHDYLFEESVCWLVRATWFTPLGVESPGDFYDDLDDIFYYQYQYQYEYEDENYDEEDLDDDYFHNSSNPRIGNRRWGDNGYIRADRQEARPIHKPNANDSGIGSSRQRKHKEVEMEIDASSSHEPKKKEVGKDLIGRRAKRALKREAADKAAAAKHQQHLVRLGRP